MLKNILELNGAQKLNKNEQRSVNGGFFIPIGLGEFKCPDGNQCLAFDGVDPICVPCNL